MQLAFKFWFDFHVQRYPILVKNSNLEADLSKIYIMNEFWSYSNPFQSIGNVHSLNLHTLKKTGKLFERTSVIELKVRESIL